MQQTNRRFGALTLAAAVLSLAPARAAPADTVAGPSFEVAVSLSAAAAARLANPKETIVVDAEFYGMPISAQQRAALQGRLDVAPEQKQEIPGAEVVKFAAPQYDKSKLSQVEGGVVDVAIEVYSGRHSSPDNLLACDFFEDAVALAASKPVAIHCKLIGEP
jgi:hypothetical protein